MDVALRTSPAASAPAPPVSTRSAPGGADGPRGSSPKAPSIAKATATSDGDALRCTTESASQIRASPQQTMNATRPVSAARRRTSARTARPRVARRPAARRAITSAPTAAGGAHHSPVIPSRTAAIATSMRRIGRSATATWPGCGASCGARRRSSAIRAGIVTCASSEPTTNAPALAVCTTRRDGAAPPIAPSDSRQASERAASPRRCSAARPITVAGGTVATAVRSSSWRATHSASSTPTPRIATVRISDRRFPCNPACSG